MDIDALREVRAHAQSMVTYYGDADQKRQQNAALAAAGLKPLHSESSLSWDGEQGAKFQRFGAALDRVIAQLSSQPMTAEDWASHAQNAFDAALPDDASPYDVGKAWQKVGEHLAAVFAEHVEEQAGLARAEAA